MCICKNGFEKIPHDDECKGMYIKFYQKHYKLYIRFLIERNATHISMGHFE